MRLNLFLMVLLLLALPGATLAQVAKEKPRVEAEKPAAAATLQALIDSPFFAGWIYLLACVGVALAGAMRANRSPGAGLAATVALSSLAYALPLALASGSAEFRYLAWPVLATLASALLLVGGTSVPKLFGQKLRD